MRLIDADALATKIMMESPDFMDGGSSITKAFILAMVKARNITPTVDAVPVVRCKDCMYWHESETEKGYGDCGQANGITLKEENWFCADGERKEGR